MLALTLVTHFYKLEDCRLHRDTYKHSDALIIDWIAKATSCKQEYYTLVMIYDVSLIPPGFNLFLLKKGDGVRLELTISNYSISDFEEDKRRKNTLENIIK